MPSNHLILCRPLLLLSSIFPSIRVFSSESVLHIRWPKCWNFSFSISPSNEYSGLISFRMDWLDLLAVQGTLKSLLQPHSSKAATLQRSGLFVVQLSHPYVPTGLTPYVCCYFLLSLWCSGLVVSLPCMAAVPDVTEGQGPPQGQAAAVPAAAILRCRLRWAIWPGHRVPRRCSRPALGQAQAGPGEDSPCPGPA